MSYCDISIPCIAIDICYFMAPENKEPRSVAGKLKFSNFVQISGLISDDELVKRDILTLLATLTLHSATAYRYVLDSFTHFKVIICSKFSRLILDMTFLCLILMKNSISYLICANLSHLRYICVQHLFLNLDA